MNIRIKRSIDHLVMYFLKMDTKFSDQEKYNRIYNIIRRIKFRTEDEMIPISIEIWNSIKDNGVSSTEYFKLSKY
jgi:hypothetical protein